MFVCGCPSPLSVNTISAALGSSKRRRTVKGLLKTTQALIGFDDGRTNQPPWSKLGFTQFVGRLPKGGGMRTVWTLYSILFTFSERRVSVRCFIETVVSTQVGMPSSQRLALERSLLSDDHKRGTDSQATTEARILIARAQPLSPTPASWIWQFTHPQSSIMPIAIQLKGQGEVEARGGVVRDNSTGCCSRTV